MLDLLKNPIVFSTLVSLGSWLAHKVLGKRADNKLARVTGALATAAGLMTQYVLTEPNKTPEEVIRAFKGIVSLQLAQVQIYEADRAPFQYLIDQAITKAVTFWTERHPAPSSLTMPITAKLGRLGELAPASP